MLHKFWKVKAATGEVVTQFASDSLSPPNGERVGVRGKYLKIKCILILAHSSIGNCGEGEKPNCTTTKAFTIRIETQNLSC
jgi:hypothetical protein